MNDSWPKSASAGITDFLRELRAVGRPQDKEQKDNGEVTLRNTPYSLQDLTSGATALTKVWTSLVAVVGGGAALTALVRAFWSSLADSVRVALVLGGAALLSVIALAIALIVRGDVASRAAVRAARHQAESTIVATALANYNFSFPSGFLVKKTDNSYLPIANIFRNSHGDWMITTPDGVTLEPNQYDAILLASDLTAGASRPR